MGRRIAFVSLAMVLAGACGETAAEVRRHTYAPSFRYLDDAQIRSSMGKLSILLTLIVGMAIGALCHAMLAGPSEPYGPEESNFTLVPASPPWLPQPPLDLAMKAAAGDTAASGALALFYDRCVARYRKADRKIADACIRLRDRWERIDFENGGSYGTSLAIEVLIAGKSCVDLRRAEFLLSRPDMKGASRDRWRKTVAEGLKRCAR